MSNTYQRTIKFYYYVPKVYKKTDKNDFEWKYLCEFNVRDWLAEVFKDGQVKSNIELTDCIVNLESIKKIENDFYAFRIYKLRDTNIPSIIKEGEDAVPIDLDPDEYVGEDTTMLYDNSQGILMMQSNRMSIGRARLEKLMTESLDDQNKRVSLKAIARKTDVSGFRGKKLKTIEFSVENLDSLDEAYQKGGLLETIKEYKKYSGYSFSIKISAGRKNEDTLDINNALDAIQELTDNKHLVNKAKVRLKDDEKPRMEEIDLLENILYDTISFSIENRQPLSFNLATMRMVSTYKERLNEIKILLR